MRRIEIEIQMAKENNTGDYRISDKGFVRIFDPLTN